MARPRTTWYEPGAHKRPRTRKRAFYWYLRENGFAPVEARMFSGYWRKYVPPGGGRKTMVPVIRKVIIERRAMQEAFILEAKAKGWGRSRREAEYQNRILGVYQGIENRRKSRGLMGKFVDAPFVRKDVHGRPIRTRINPWSLKEDTWMTLPEEDQWDTPRSHWNHPPTAWSKSPMAQMFSKKKLTKSIRDLKRDIRDLGDPTGWRESQILLLQYQLKNGVY